MVSSTIHEVPITGICIVADKYKAPIGYQSITRAYDDRNAEADLYKDGFFSRVSRYLTVSRSIPPNTTSVKVLTDLVITNFGETLPHGYSLIDKTEDSNEKALRRKQLWIRMVDRASAVDAICEIAVLLRSGKKVPPKYTLAGAQNGLLYPGLGLPYPLPNNNNQNPTPPPAQLLNYYPNRYDTALISNNKDTANNNNNFGYIISNNNGTNANKLIDIPTTRELNEVNPRQPSQSAAETGRGDAALDGVTFKLHPSLLPNAGLGGKRVPDTTLPELPNISREQINAEYDYSFINETAYLTSLVSSP